jgi:tetratricopeptide (TPR) repeat protein
VSIALNNIGLVYYKLEDYVHTVDYFKQAFELRSKNGEPLPNGDINYYVTSLANLGLCYSYMNEFETAAGYVEKALQHSQKGCTDQALVTVYFGSGLLQCKQGNLKKASATFLQSLALARKISDRRGELDNLTWLSEVSVKSNQFAEAERYLLQAEPLFNDDTPFRAELAEVYAQLGRVYIKLGNYQKAAIYQSKHIDLSAKVYTRQLTINLMKVQAQYLERENKDRIEAQEKILALDNDVIAQQRALNIVIGIVAVLLIALVFTLTLNVRQKRMANQLLDQRVKERTSELEANQIALAKSLEERNLQMKRISNEIKSSLATITGLCKLSTQDVNVINAGQYIDKIEKASHNLQLDIYRTLGIGENGI